MSHRNTTVQPPGRLTAFGRAPVIIAGFSAFALVAGCSGSGEQRKRNPASEAPMNNSTTGRVQCAGRFSFLAPETMNVTGRSQSMYLTNVTTIPVPPGGIDAYWKDRLAQIGALQPRVFALQADVKSAWSARNSTFPNDLTLEIVKPVNAGLMVVECEADAGKENIAETLVRDIVNAYVPASDRGFCVGNGAITLEPSQNEQVRLSLEGSGFPEIEIRLETRTVREPDMKTYSDVDEEKSLASEQGGTLTVLLDRQRSAAGLPGKEIWISFAAPGDKPNVRFSWHYQGVGASGTQPSINIVGSAPVEKKSQLEAIWESVLTSLRAVPLAAGRK
jgi:hypothetical protein